MHKSSHQAKILTTNNLDNELLPFLVLLCAGEGRRFGEKKQLLPIGGLPLFFHALLSFAEVMFSCIVLVVPPQDNQTIAESLRHCTPRHKNQQKWWDVHKNRLHIVVGGAERWISSAKAIAWLNENTKITPSIKKKQTVIIHDGARALLDKKDLAGMLKKWKEKKENCVGMIAAKMLTDTIKLTKIDKNGQLYIHKHPPRKDFVAVSTPQIFDFEQIKKAYEKARLSTKAPKINFTDDAEVMALYGPKLCPIQLYILEKSNPKLTYGEELSYFADALKRM